MTSTLYAHHPSALGPLLLVGERGPDGMTILTGCYLPGHRRGVPVGPAWREEPAAFAAIGAAIDAELAGGRLGYVADAETAQPADAPPAGTPPAGHAARIPVAFRGGTPFQRCVWEELRAVPRGTTLTYGELAARIGRPGAGRAVGAAVARNPISIVVPCHRVVGSDGSLTGYAGGVEAKRTLLALEGAT